jgi:hypothetical protein
MPDHSRRLPVRRYATVFGVRLTIHAFEGVPKKGSMEMCAEIHRPLPGKTEVKSTYKLDGTPSRTSLTDAELVLALTFVKVLRIDVKRTKRMYARWAEARDRGEPKEVLDALEQAIVNPPDDEIVLHPPKEEAAFEAWLFSDEEDDPPASNGKKKATKKKKKGPP